jgi:hypothetical protein
MEATLDYGVAQVARTLRISRGPFADTYCFRRNCRSSSLILRIASLSSNTSKVSTSSANLIDVR